MSSSFYERDSSSPSDLTKESECSPERGLRYESSSDGETNVVNQSQHSDRPASLVLQSLYQQFQSQQKQQHVEDQEKNNSKTRIEEDESEGHHDHGSSLAHDLYEQYQYQQYISSRNNRHLLYSLNNYLNHYHGQVTERGASSTSAGSSIIPSSPSTSSLASGSMLLDLGQNTLITILHSSLSLVLLLDIHFRF